MVEVLEWWPDHGGQLLHLRDGRGGVPVDLDELPLSRSTADLIRRWLGTYADDKLPSEGSGDPVWIDEGIGLLQRCRQEARSRIRGRGDGTLVGRADDRVNTFPRSSVAGSEALVDASTCQWPRRPWSAGCGSAEMSVGLDVVGAAVGAGPGEGPRAGAGVGPGGVGLEPVVPTAQWRQILAGGSTDGVFEDVVGVRAPAMAGCTWGTRRSGGGAGLVPSAGRSPRSSRWLRFSVRSSTGRTVTWVPACWHQLRSWSGVTVLRVFSTSTIARVGVGVGVDHDLPLDLALDLGAGAEEAGGHRAAHVQRQLRGRGSSRGRRSSPRARTRRPGRARPRRAPGRRRRPGAGGRRSGAARPP